MSVTRVLRPVVRLSLPLLAALAAGCGGGGGGGGGGGFVGAPSGLLYNDPRATYLVGVEIPANHASFNGEVTSFSVAPPLPVGLRLDPLTGDLEGTPTAQAPRTVHTITASNASGSTHVDVEVAVERPARYLLAANAADSTLSSYRIDAATGALLPHSFAAAGADQIGPETICVHPSGRFAYVPNSATTNVSVYALDAQTGFLSPGTPVSVGSGPHHMVLRPDGAFAFVVSEGASQVLVFAVDPVTGALSQVGAPLSTRTQPISVAVDPSGSMMLVGNQGTPRSLQLFSIDAQSGALSGPVATLGLNGGLPASVEFDPTGRFAFATLENYDAVISLLVDESAGALTLVSPSGTGDQPGALVVHPLGDFTYVANRATGSVSSYRVNPATGSLTPIETVPAGSMPSNALLDPTGGFLYVLDRGGREVLAFSVDTKTGTLAALGKVRARQAPVAFALVPGDGPVHALATHAYVANGDSDDVSTFRLDPVSGAMTEVGLAALTGDVPSDVAVDPLRRFAWVADLGDDTVRTYAVDGVTGALFENAPVLAVGDEPNALAVDPSGRFLFVSHRAANTVGAFRIAALDGSLLPIATLPLPNGMTVPSDLVVDPTGQFLFAAAEGDGTPGTAGVIVWSVDAHTGAPVLLAPPAPGMRASRLLVHPSGRQLYAAERLTDSLSVFSIAASNGALTGLPSASLSGDGPSAIVIDPTGRDAYLTFAGAGAPGEVSWHQLDPLTGALQAVSSSLLAGVTPIDALLEPNGRFLYVLNRSSNSISAFRRDPLTGQLAPPIGTLTGLAPNAIAVATRWQ